MVRFVAPEGQYGSAPAATSQAQHSLAATASHHRLARRTSTRHHVQRTKQASTKARVMLRLSASRAQISWPVEEEACRGSDDVSASRCDAAREQQATCACGKSGTGHADRTFRSPHWSRRSPTRSRPLQCRSSRWPRSFERTFKISAVK